MAQGKTLSRQNDKLPMCRVQVPTTTNWLRRCGAYDTQPKGVDRFDSCNKLAETTGWVKDQPATETNRIRASSSDWLESHPYKVLVAGSNPAWPITDSVAQWQQRPVETPV